MDGKSEKRIDLGTEALIQHSGLIDVFFATTIHDADARDCSRLMVRSGGFDAAKTRELPLDVDHATGVA